MKKNKRESILLFAPDLKGIEGFANNLNTEYFWWDFQSDGTRKRTFKDYRPVQRELRRLVQAWFNSGPNVSKLLAAEPILAREARSFRAQLFPTKSGRARLAYLTAPEKISASQPLAIALGLFLDFLLNRYNEKLGGPCAQCKNYYVKKTKRQKVYCSKDCGLKRTSQAANRKRRAKEHLEQVETAKGSALQWTTAKTKLDWKDWVSRDTGISKNALTRAVRSKELSEPTKRA